MMRRFLNERHVSPSPLVGEGGEGGREGMFEALTHARDISNPTPTPPHKGEGNEH
jgi:hypothetical protein